MELELHQLDRRYEQLRTSSQQREGRILASLDRHGQQLPVVVVCGDDEGRYVLVDGYKRVRALHKLSRDTVRATCWELSEDEALLLGRLMQTTQGDSALEQGWLLRELRERFGLTVEELAQRFDRSLSWVSGRLGLVSELPEPIQELVRQGRLVPHAAMRFLLPLTRTDRQGAIKLATVIAPLRPSSRQTKSLCIAYARANEQGRRYLLQHPELFALRPGERHTEPLPSSSGELLLCDLGALGGIARRAAARVAEGAVRELLPPEQEELRRRGESARGDVALLLKTLDQEIDDARRAPQDNHSKAI